MKTVITRTILLVFIFGIFVYGCTPKSRYERKLKHELATGIRNDSLFMGLYFGMPEKDFYTKCWKLNQQGLIKQGPKNRTVEYMVKKELRFPGSMNFYPDFVDGKIAEMPVQFAYTGWAPWNKKLSSDSLQIDVLHWFEKKYGKKFMKIDHPTKGSAFVNLDGNRRITIFKEDEMSVWAVFTDMSVTKEISDTSRVQNIPENISKDLK
jgi:hypothetical protein